MSKVLESRGWELVGISGSHHICRHSASRRRISVLVRGNVDLKPKTQYNLMRDAGLIDDEF